MTIPAPLLSGTRREFPIEVILHSAQSVDASAAFQLYEGERALMGYVLPPWQRSEVWDQARKARFIESILLGLGAGYYVLTQPDWLDDGARRPMSSWLLDGQQRISAIRDFVADAFPVFTDPRWNIDGGRLYSELDERTRRLRFHQVAFPCVEISGTHDEAVLKLLYDRLNFGGIAHADSDRVLLD